MTRPRGECDGDTGLADPEPVLRVLQLRGALPVLAKARPTEGHRDVVVAVHVTKGAYGPAELGGLSGALAVQTPGAMADGDWSAAMYLDERATPEQRAGLEAILSGQAGGPLARLAPLIATRLASHGQCAALLPAVARRGRGATGPGRGSREGQEEFMASGRSVALAGEAITASRSAAPAPSSRPGRARGGHHRGRSSPPGTAR